MTDKTNYDLSTFSKEGKIEDIKVGTKIWYMHDTNIDQATVTYINSDEDYIDAFWERAYGCSTVFYNSFNKDWGIIVEKRNKHKNYDVIVHWANGGEIQTKSGDREYKDWVPVFGFKQSPNFDNDSIEFRIKPKTEIKKYRLALLKNNELKVFENEPSLDDAFGENAFLRWIDSSWKHIEVEIT